MFYTLQDMAFAGKLEVLNKFILFEHISSFLQLRFYPASISEWLSTFRDFMIHTDRCATRSLFFSSGLLKQRLLIYSSFKAS